MSIFWGFFVCLFVCCFGNAIMVSLLYVHAKRTGRKIRPWPKPVILKIKMIQILNHCRANQYELISDGKQNISVMRETLL